MSDQTTTPRPLGLARDTLDPGLFSDNAPTMEAHYIEKVGLPFLEHLPHGPTYGELFFTLPDGKLKIQATSEPLQSASSGYSTLLIARDGLEEPRELVDPDGNCVHLVPPGHRGVTGIAIECVVADGNAQERFLVEGLGAQRTVDGFRVGGTQLFVREDRSAPRPTPPWRRGFTYITVIVHDARDVHQRLIAAGAEHSLRTLRLLDRCLFSWVRDPNGNWIEIVQYADLSGPLPDIDRIDSHWEEVVQWREAATPF